MNRGAAYMDGRLFRGTSDAHVIAIDAADGHTIWDVALDVAGRGVTVPMAPTAWNGLVFVGNAGGDLSGIIGHVYALDATDGHVVWKFDVVPATDRRARRGRPPIAIPISGGAFWTSFTLDERAGVLYVAAAIRRRTTTSPCAMARISIRILSLRSNATDGRLLAYNQLVKHDFHDWDVDSPAPLVTTRARARRSPRRRTRTVCSRSSIAESRERAARCRSSSRRRRRRARTSRRRSRATARRASVRATSAARSGTARRIHPSLNTLYVGAADWCSTVQLVPDIGAGAADRARAGLARRRQAMDPPANAKGWLTAFDADNGAVRWKFAAPRPMLAGVTPTAGGLVFAADLGGTLYAFDADKGAIALAAGDRTVDGRRDRQLSRGRQAAHRRRGGNEVADLAGRIVGESDRRVRVAVVDCALGAKAGRYKIASRESTGRSVAARPGNSADTAWHYCHRLAL